MTERDKSWRCLGGRAQMKTCRADGGHCFVSDCPHGAWIPRGETTAHWRKRVDREWIEAQRKRDLDRNTGRALASKWSRREERLRLCRGLPVDLVVELLREDMTWRIGR